MQMIDSILLILAGYLWGSISPSFVAARILKGIDLRQYGTGQVGGSNAGRQLGRRWLLIIGFADFLKGLIATALARAWGFDLLTVVFVALATVLGHNWSLFLGFSGGRGLATTMGALLAWDVRLVLMPLLFFVFTELTGHSGKGPMIAFILLAPFAWLVGDPPAFILGSFLLAVLITLKRLEANRLPLPRAPRERRAVLWRRLWLDRDVPAEQPWEERKRFV